MQKEKTVFVTGRFASMPVSCSWNRRSQSLSGLVGLVPYASELLSYQSRTSAFIGCSPYLVSRNIPGVALVLRPLEIIIPVGCPL